MICYDAEEDSVHRRLIYSSNTNILKQYYNILAPLLLIHASQLYTIQAYALKVTVRRKHCTGQQ